MNCVSCSLTVFFGSVKRLSEASLRRAALVSGPRAAYTAAHAGECSQKGAEMRTTLWMSALATALLTLNLGGCNFDFVVNPPDDHDELPAGLVALDNRVDVVQTADPRDAELPAVLVDDGDTIVIDADVTVIVDVHTDFIVADLPDQTVIGFENLTGYDLYLRYYADDVVQGVYVLDGETLLLDYPCLNAIELLSEDDIDPVSGLLAQSYELTGLFLNPDDFYCGDAVILTFDPFAITTDIDLIDLLP
jgi:hypothetical protein